MKIYPKAIFLPLFLNLHLSTWYRLTMKVIAIIIIIVIHNKKWLFCNTKQVKMILELLQNFTVAF